MQEIFLSPLRNLKLLGFFWELDYIFTSNVNITTPPILLDWWRGVNQVAIIGNLKQKQTGQIGQTHLIGQTECDRLSPHLPPIYTFTISLSDE